VILVASPGKCYGGRGGCRGCGSQCPVSSRVKERNAAGSATTSFLERNIASSEVSEKQSPSSGSRVTVSNNAAILAVDIRKAALPPISEVLHCENGPIAVVAGGSGDEQEATTRDGRLQEVTPREICHRLSF